MKKIIPLLLLSILISCKKTKTVSVENENSSVVKDTISKKLSVVFASCNHQNMEQPLWKAIRSTKPDVFIWGGDNIYADTENMDSMAFKYQIIKTQPDYAQLVQETKILGTWDDHDYGKNDGGEEWEYKKEAQQLFLDFLDIPKEDKRRNREGVYHSETITTKNGSVKVILLDTRYFRGPLKENPEEGKRYQPWDRGEGTTILGEKQWQWLEKELEDNKAEFTMIVSSIQFIANEHSWEQWGNFPEEVEKMEQLIAKAKANRIFIVSGDRHLAELSKKNIKGLAYPLIDFTTSGMTNTYPENPDDPNRYRIGNQVRQLNFGWFSFDFDKREVQMQIRGENNVKYLSFTCF